MWGIVLAAFLAALSVLWFYRGEGGVLAEAGALLHGNADASFGSGRIGIWRQLVPLVRGRPLLGGGCGTLGLRDLEPFYSRAGGKAVPLMITSAHNEYLGILVDQGLAAFLSFLALLFFALRKCFRAPENDRLAIAGCALLGYAVMAFFSVAGCITTPYLWILLSLIEKEQTEKPSALSFISF